MKGVKLGTVLVFVVGAAAGCGDEEPVKCTGGAVPKDEGCDCPADKPLFANGMCVAAVTADGGVTSDGGPSDASVADATSSDAKSPDSTIDANAGGKDASAVPEPSDAGSAHDAAEGGLALDGAAPDAPDSSDAGMTSPSCIAVDEVCDGIDNDCDGAVDEGVANACGGCTVLANVKGAPCTVGVGACGATGTYECVGAELICSAVPNAPSAEICDGIDNNCSGLIDEGVKNACGGCGPITIGPNAQSDPGHGCAYYWTDSPDCASLGTTVCNGPNLLICDAPRPSCAM